MEDEHLAVDSSTRLLLQTIQRYKNPIIANIITHTDHYSNIKVVCSVLLTKYFYQKIYLHVHQGVQGSICRSSSIQQLFFFLLVLNECQPKVIKADFTSRYAFRQKEGNVQRFKSYNFQLLPIWVLLYPACKKVLFRFLSCFRKALISQQKKRALKPLLIVVLFIRLAFRKNGRKVADGKRTQDHRSEQYP